MATVIAAALIEAGVVDALAYILGYVATAYILSEGAQLLTRSPARIGGGSLTSQGRNLSVRQTISPWQIVYGQARVGGDITFVFQTTDKRYLHVVITLCAHVSQEIGDLWLDDEVVTPAMLNASGEVTSGRFSSADPVDRFESWLTTELTSIGGGLFTYTTQHDVNVVWSVVDDDSDAPQPFTDVSPSNPAVGSHQYKRVGNVITLGQSIGGNINYQESVFVPVTRIKKSLGDEAGQPFPDLVSESEGKWTDAHRQTGHTKIYLRFDLSRLRGGVPAISAVVKGKKLFDPRTSGTAWSANPALAIYDYLTNTEYGFGADASELSSSEVQAAANLCDESVALSGGGSEARYTVNGSFRTSERRVDVLESLKASMAGAITQVSDTWRIFGGAYEAPTLTLDEGDFAGPIQIDPLASRDQWANGVKGVFINPAANWQPTDFPAVKPAAYLAADNNEEIFADLDFTRWITSSSTAQRLGKIELLRRRFGLTVTATFKLTAWQALTGRTVALTFAKYGWTAKEFAILEAGFVMYDGGGAPALGVRLVLREISAAHFSWTAEEQPQTIPPATSLPNPFATPAAIAGLAASSGTADLLRSGDGTVLTRVHLTWTAISDGVSLGGRLEIEHRRADESTYVQDGFVPPNKADHYLVGLRDGDTYVFRIRARSALNVAGDWAFVQHTVIGKTAPPADVGSLSFADPIVSWPANTDVDLAGYVVRHQDGASNDWNTATPAHQQGFITETQFDTGKVVGGSRRFLVRAIDTTGNLSATATTLVVDLRPVQPSSFFLTRQPDGTREFAWNTASAPVDLDGAQIRYFLGSTADWDAMTPLHTGLLKASPFETNQLAAGTYTFAIKNVDKAGNASASATFITSVTIGDPRIAGAIIDQNEGPAWAGTKTSCVLSGAAGWLVAADTTSQWATLPSTWAAWTSWHQNPASSMQYEVLIDIGIKTKFTPLVSVTVDGTATIEEAHSDDGISYSSFATVGPQLDARFVKIRVTVAGSFPKLKSERIILSGSPIEEVIGVLDTSTLTGSYRIGVGDVRLPIVKTYNIIQFVNVALMSVGPGWSWELIDTDTTVGPRVKIYDETDTLADANVLANVKGV